eukprot:TRINITY_DN2318_c0_g1_i4.p1 TRINITY_DN2318_c0_g1~~TRINITY_DN2318_c0_g1_i4.p1  ORF type:complete len:543 (-),score=97.67 TRINITY_DN2318_c0_g1_i4:170-1798(-)
MPRGRSRSASRSRSKSSPKNRRQRVRSGTSSPRRSRGASSPRRRRAASGSRSKSRSKSGRNRKRSGRRQRAPSTRRSDSSDVSSDGEARCRIWVAHADCARIIGRKGEARMDIERQSEANVRIQREEDMDSDKKERSIELVGRMKQRKRALKLILKVATYVRDDSGNVLKDASSGGSAVGATAGSGNADSGTGSAEVLQIPCNEVGRILGRGGENIRRIEDEAGARLELDRAEGRLLIRGGFEAVAKAKEMVLVDVSHARSGDGTVIKDDLVNASAGMSRPNGGPLQHGAATPSGGNQPFKLWVYSREAGRVIGRGGETVRDLMQRTGCEIQVERTSGGEQPQSERLIQLFGAVPQVREAFACITREVTYVRGENVILKSPEMTPQEAEESMRVHGPGGLGGVCGMMMPNGGMPPGMLPPRGMMPPMGMMGMMGPPGMSGPPPNMMPPQAMMMPGMMPPPGMMHPMAMMGPPPGHGCGAGGMPPARMPPQGLPCGPTPPNDGAPPNGGSCPGNTAGHEGAGDGGSYNAPWNSKRPVDDWDDL